MKNIKFFVLVAFAAGCLFLLKATGILVNGGYALNNIEVAEKEHLPVAVPDEAPLFTGSIEKEGKEEGKTVTEADKPEKATEIPKSKGVRHLLENQQRLMSEAEADLLESLARRRKKLEERERAVDMQEKLLKAAGKSIETRIAKLKLLESRIQETLNKEETRKKEQYEKLVSLYSKMKPVDAARIFNRLDMNILVGLIERMKPRSVAAIIAAMTPAKAEQLTMEMAGRSRPEADTNQLADLPRIGG
jgi:flagellar motility protein MotE (MotC chaperone)